jgi:hypothetical protein
MSWEVFGMEKIAYHTVERRRWYITDIVKEISVRAKLADDHDWRVACVLRNADTMKANNIGVIKFTEQFELFNIH